MDLWIRNQDETILMKVDNLLIDDDDYSIYTHNYINTMEMTYTLGRYKTKERALEVLNQIYELFKFSINNKTTSEVDVILKAYMLPKIYDMPKE